MNSSNNPLIRPQTPFERRVVDAIDRSKPGRSVGVFNRPLPGGVSQISQGSNRGGASTSIHPFWIYSSGKMHAGTVNGAIPTLAGSPIGESGNALSLSGSKYIYIKNLWTLVFGSSHYLTSATLTERTIVSNTSPLTDSTTSGVLTTYRLVAQIIDGKVQRTQQTSTNVSNSVCDASSGTSEGKAVRSNWFIS
jgi:hypothetical protein